MSELKRVPFTPVFSLSIICVLAGTSVPFSQEASGALPPVLWPPSLSINPPTKFNPILEALADEEPQIRRMAEFAMVFRSRMEFGPQEMAALAKLLQEHCSEELLSAVEQCLFSSEPEIIAGAAPELAGLINHNHKEVRERTLVALERMDTPPPETAAALAQRLSAEQGNNAQTQIIGMLEGIGPAAKVAVPVLVKYTEHDDPNIRHLALEALG